MADTVRNRESLRLGAATIRADFPLDTRDVIGALAAGRTPALNGVVILRIPSGRSTGRPHRRETRGRDPASAAASSWTSPLAPA